MKVSLNWLREFLDIHKSPSEIADILTSLGLEVEGWDDVKPSPVDLDKVLTGNVLSCERIPDTDHLSATTVDVGDGVARSIVCGAPNIAMGQKVFVALPGANVFSKDGTIFTIGERKVRGIASQGMICAPDELGVGHDHSGILVLPPDTALGVTAAEWYRQESDTIIEIGLTPNRADATNHLGVARDLMAWVRHHENPAATLRLHDYSRMMPGAVTSPLPFQVEVKNHEACPAYYGLVISGLTVAESPDWLKNRLLAIGQRPINNVVDVTNYVRAELGQPLHAFDLQKIKGNKIIVQTLPEGSTFKSLDGVERKLFAEDLMICDGESNPMCIGGVFGGAESGVTDATTAIFLESACFNPKWIRRSMLRHNLRTDAAWVFEKGVDPSIQSDALLRAYSLLVELAGGQAATGIFKIQPQAPVSARVEIEYARVNRLIGENLPAATIKNILSALEIGIEQESATGLTAVIPTNKPDVTREADVVEEILRVYGLDNVPIPTQIRSSIEIQQQPNPDSVRNLASEFLAANGFNECMNLSLSNKDYYIGQNKVLPLEGLGSEQAHIKSDLVFIQNTANQGLNCLRPTLLMPALETILRNQNRQHPDLRLFEFGKVYRDTGSNSANKQLHPSFKETLRLGIFLTGRQQSEIWQNPIKKDVDFYTLKGYVEGLLNRLGIQPVSSLLDTSGFGMFQFALRYQMNPGEIVTFGKVNTAITQKMDLKNAVFFADFHFENVLKAVAGNKIQFQELNRFPTVRRDFALVLDKAVQFGDIRQLATKTAKKMLKEVNLFDVFEDETKLGIGKKSYAVSFVFEDPEKTLQDKEIDALMQQLQQAFETKLNATIRK